MNKLRELYLNNELLKAITNKDVKKVKELLDEGADINGNLLPSWNPVALAFTYWRRYSPLHCALGRSSYEVIEELVHRGANVNEIHYWFTLDGVFSYTKATTIELALIRFDEDDKSLIVKLLLDHGFDITLCGNCFLEGPALSEIKIRITDPASATELNKVIQSNFKEKKELLTGIEDNPDHAAFTKKQPVPSLFFLSYKQLINSRELKKSPNRYLPDDVKERIKDIEKNSTIYNPLKAQVKAYESHFRANSM